MANVDAANVGGHIEANRWYDIRIETAGGRIKCYLDGKLVQDAEPSAMKTLFASATRDLINKELILKLVNGSYESQSVDLRIEGAEVADGPAVFATTLTSKGAMDENSINEPLLVSPKPVKVGFSKGLLRHELPANSFTVIRLRTK